MTTTQTPLSVDDETGDDGRRRTLTAQQLNEGGLAVALVVLCVTLAFVTDSFATERNFWNILGDAALVGIVAWASTLVIVAGEIDISLGPAVAFWGVILAKLDGAWGFSLVPAIALTLLGGALVGALAGWLRGQFGVPSFIVTLALWSSLRGLAQFMTDALPVPLQPSGFLDRLGGKVGVVPTAAIVMFVLFAIFVFIARSTTFGRSVYAVGGNARAAKLSGIDVLRVRVILFATSGMMAALLGIIVAGRLASGNSGAAQGLEFSVIAAVVIGGTPLQGGRGSMLGTLLGVLFITVIGNGLVILGVNSFFQDVVRGGLILVAVLINTVLGNRTGQRTD